MVRPAFDCDRSPEGIGVEGSHNARQAGAFGGSKGVSAPPDRAARFLRFCRAERFYRVAVFGAAPLLAVIFFLTPATPTGIRVAIASAAVYMGLIVAWRRHTTSYICWQCGRPFHHRDGVLVQFTNTCLHCGAPPPDIWTRALPN